MAKRNTKPMREKRAAKPAKRRAPPAPAKKSGGRTWQQRMRAGEQVSGEEILREKRVDAKRLARARNDNDEQLTSYGKKLLREQAARETPAKPPAAVGPYDDDPARITPGTPVFVAWAPGQRWDETKRKRGVLLKWNRNGKAVVAIARVDTKGNYTGDVPTKSERTFEPGEVWPIHEAIGADESAAAYDERNGRAPDYRDDVTSPKFGQPTDEHVEAKVGATDPAPQISNAAALASMVKGNTVTVPAPYAVVEGSPVHIPAPAKSKASRRARATPAASDGTWNCNCGGTLGSLPRHMLGATTLGENRCRFDAERDADGMPVPFDAIVRLVETPTIPAAVTMSATDAEKREAVAARLDELNAEPRGRDVGNVEHGGSCPDHGFALRRIVGDLKRQCQISGCPYTEYLFDDGWHPPDKSASNEIVDDPFGAEAPPPWE